MHQIASQRIFISGGACLRTSLGPLPQTINHRENPADGGPSLILKQHGYPSNSHLIRTWETQKQFIQQVSNGNFIVVFGSLECLLSTHTWRGICKCQSFTEMLLGAGCKVVCLFSFILCTLAFTAPQDFNTI